MPSETNQFQDADSTLFIAFDLSLSNWKLAFGTDPRGKPRFCSMDDRDLNLLRRRIDEARRAFGLGARAPVVSCYEAGRDGFWLHRFLTGEGIQNHVVDSASQDRPAGCEEAADDAHAFPRW